MVSVQRRLNSTGRKRIPRDRVTIDLEPPRDAGAFPRGRARVELSGLDLPDDASVVLEAYFRSSSQRFSCGTVQHLAPPKMMELTDIDRGGAIQFRLLVIAANGSGRIVAAADGVRPIHGGEDEGADRLALLPVTETDLGEEVWRVDIDPRTGPRLLLNSRVPGLVKQLQGNHIYQGLILPQALRTVLRALPLEGQDDDDALWGANWRRFLGDIEIATEPERWDDDDSREDWIEEAVARFCMLKTFAENLRGLIAPEGEA